MSSSKIIYFVTILVAVLFLVGVIIYEYAQYMN